MARLKLRIRPLVNDVARAQQDLENLFASVVQPCGNAGAPIFHGGDVCDGRIDPPAAVEDECSAFFVLDDDLLLPACSRNERQWLSSRVSSHNRMPARIHQAVGREIGVRSELATKASPTRAAEARRHVDDRSG